MPPKKMELMKPEPQQAQALQPAQQEKSNEPEE